MKDGASGEAPSFVVVEMADIEYFCAEIVQVIWSFRVQMINLHGHYTEMEVLEVLEDMARPTLI